jgi:hypothetical protein
MSKSAKKQFQRAIRNEGFKIIKDLTSTLLSKLTRVKSVKKEIPIMLEKRAEKLIRELEAIAKDGEKRLNKLISKKINPFLDLIEDWLKTSSKRTSKPKKKKAAVKPRKKSRKPKQVRRKTRKK